MKNYIVLVLFCSISCIASDTQRKHVQQERYYQKELPYVLVDGHRVIIIQNPQTDRHVHTIKRTKQTIYALAEQQRLQAKQLLKK